MFTPKSTMLYKIGQFAQKIALVQGNHIPEEIKWYTNNVAVSRTNFMYANHLLSYLD